MARVYSIIIDGVNVSAQQDLMNIAATANMAFTVIELDIESDNQSSVQQMAIVLKKMTATVTNGTGGSSFTPIPLLGSDAASTITARINDSSTRATTGGTTTKLESFSLNVLNGYNKVWGLPEMRPVWRPSENLILGLETTPSTTFEMRAYLKVMELF